MRSYCAAVALLLVAGQALAQPRVAPRHLYERLLCVVPMVGKGTHDDPRRPLFAPLPQAIRATGQQPQIIGFTYQESDDGKFALVEFVARDRKALAPMLTDPRSDIKVFEKGKANRDDIEREFRKYKKDFDLDRFGVSVP